MNHIELEKCKRLAPTTSKSVDSFGNCDTLKTVGRSCLRVGKTIWAGARPFGLGQGCLGWDEDVWAGARPFGQG